MAHWMDEEPLRFGWRYWRLHDSGTRLFGPVHGAPARFGRRFAEQAICAHTRPDADPLALNEDCYCGVYYVPDREPFMDLVAGDYWINEWPANSRALTYGVAVGGFGPDPVVPERFMRAPRFRFLEMVVPEERGDEFRARHPDLWTAKVISTEFLDMVETSARDHLRGVNRSEFLETARQEPVLPAAEHVCDVHPDHFGWRAWLIGAGDGNGAELFDTGDGISPLTSSPDGPYAEWDDGVVYLRSLNYALSSWNSNLEHAIVRHGTSRADYVVAFTYGYAPGPVDRPPDKLVSRRYNVLRLCIPDTYSHLAEELSKRYGIEVTTSTTTGGLYAAEQSAWRELADTPEATLFPGGVSDPPVAPAPASIRFDGDTRPDPHAHTAEQRAANAAERRAAAVAEQRAAVAARRAAVAALEAEHQANKRAAQSIEFRGRLRVGQVASPLEYARRLAFPPR